MWFERTVQDLNIIFFYIDDLVITFQFQITSYENSNFNFTEFEFLYNWISHLVGLLLTFWFLKKIIIYLVFIKMPYLCLLVESKIPCWWKFFFFIFQNQSSKFILTNCLLHFSKFSYLSWNNIFLFFDKAYCTLHFLHFLH